MPGTTYPITVDAANSLGVPADKYTTKPLTTTLGASCLSTDTTIQLAVDPTTVGAPARYGIASIGDEKIWYDNHSGVNITGCVRGYGGSTAAAHANGAAVAWKSLSDYLTLLQAAVEAIETTLGVTGAFNFVVPPVVEADITLADNTTDNVSSTKHGFAPKSPADAKQFLNGAATPAYAQPKDSDLSTSDITTNNVGTTKHGFAPKAPNDATKFLDGTGAYSTPSGGGGKFLAVYPDDVNCPHNGTATDVYTTSVPANTLAHNGDTLKLFFTCNFLPATSNQVFSLVLLGVTVFDSGLGVQFSEAVNSRTLVFHITIMRKTSSSVRCTVEWETSTTTSGSATRYTDTVTGFDFTTTGNLVLTMTTGSSSSNPSVVAEMGYLEFTSAP